MQPWVGSPQGIRGGDPTQGNPPCHTPTLKELDRPPLFESLNTVIQPILW